MGMNDNKLNVKEILEFYLLSGVDETCGDDAFFKSCSINPTVEVKNKEK